MKYAWRTSPVQVVCIYCCILEGSEGVHWYYVPVPAPPRIWRVLLSTLVETYWRPAVTMTVTMTTKLWIYVVTFVVMLPDTPHGLVLNDLPCIAPAPCTCRGSNNVQCGYKSLTDIPRLLPDASKDYIHEFHVSLDNNMISTIQTNAFKNLSSINTTKLSIKLNNNKISTIDLNAFAGVEHSTYEIDLSGNKLSTLPMALTTLNNLQHLYITHNDMQALDSSVLSKLGDSLTEFSFDMGQFQSWPYEIGDLHHLKSLTIHTMQFHHIPANAFDHLEPTLTSLTLLFTQITEIPTAICPLYNLNTLQLLHASQLNIEPLLKDMCPSKLLNLTRLDLVFDNLDTFPDVLKAFSSLSVLRLFGNNISFIHPNQVPPENEITELDLSRNGFTHIPFAINRMRKLRRLYLASNQIGTVEDHDLINSSELELLDFDDNPIVYIAPDAFIHNLVLTRIHLRNPLLTVVSEALASLPSQRHSFSPETTSSAHAQWHTSKDGLTDQSP